MTVKIAICEKFANEGGELYGFDNVANGSGGLAPGNDPEQGRQNTNCEPPGDIRAVFFCPLEMYRFVSQIGAAGCLIGSCFINRSAGFPGFITYRLLNRRI
ncbi:MAG: hypothetical protein V3V15_07010 [Sphingorhabdus sp.]